MSQAHSMFIWLPAICCAIAIFIQSSIPGEKIPPSALFTYDKLIHTGIYFVFGLSLAFALCKQRRFPYLREHWFVSGMLIAVLYAISDETHQLFVPKRAADIVDLNADVLGIVLAFLLFRWLEARQYHSAK
ncbi:MAG: VanZ family protein [Chloroherpetonaceae bacterium]|nr:VanZ family protein [Chloroherpetonaceae bacterium]MCS7211830.1 VanZ family protein [Chloroherpetonaceae bacterium]MDW8019581.1 VanZ family protein [Chloroherpetonaceae bacterium]